MTRDDLPRLVRDLLGAGVGMVVKGGEPHLSFDDKDERAARMAREAAPLLAANLTWAAQLFREFALMGVGRTMPVQCEECRGWVYSLSQAKDACELPVRQVRARPCRFRPAT